MTDQAPSTPSPATPSESAAPVTGEGRRARWITLLVGLGLALFALSAVGFGVATVLEEEDTFCTNCHTIPETTYYNRAYIAFDHPDEQVYDLASAHYQRSARRGEVFACISCHRGDSSLGQRLATFALAGKDTVIWLTGRENPAIEKGQISAAWLPNAACAGCHSATLLVISGIGNHFHTHLPQAAQALANGGKLTIVPALGGDPALLQAQWLASYDADLTCTSCHQVHSSQPIGNALFINPDLRNQACVACHVKAGQGPQDLTTLGR